MIGSWVKDTWNKPFDRYLLLTLLVIGIALIMWPSSATMSVAGSGPDIHFFYLETCPHCHEQMKFNPTLVEKYDVNIIAHNIGSSSDRELYIQYADRFNISQAMRGTPLTVIGDQYQLGFGSAETTGKQLEEKIEQYLLGTNATSDTKTYIVNIPFFGSIDAMALSLPTLAIILGLIDGFNPCAMWVLVYLISLIMGLKDRRKIWFLVGTFVGASGILYFLFMTAWLNVFLIVGYLRPLTIIIGVGAIYMGILGIREYLITKGALVCKVGDMDSKKKTMSKMRDIVHAPTTITSIFAIIVLAFVVNSIEFACSSAIPVVFTQVLALSNLSWLAHYGLILLYDVFFMIDDLIIFGLAAFTVSTAFGDKYAKYCKIIGGVLLLLLGIALAFFPNMLQG